MKVPAIRNALLVFGAASFGIWVGWLLFLPALGTMRIGSVRTYTGNEARVHEVLMIVGPHAVGAAVAGLVLGCVTRGNAARPWAIGLVVILETMILLPALFYGDFFGGTAGPLLHSLELIGTCVLALVGLWLGRLVRIDGAVA